MMCTESRNNRSSSLGEVRNPIITLGGDVQTNFTGQTHRQMDGRTGGPTETTCGVHSFV
jgi:hypothetical protein